MTLADQLADEIAQGKGKRLLKVIASEIAMDPELRSTFMNNIVPQLATKEDLEKLERRMDEKIERLRRELKEEITALRQEFKEEVMELRKEFKEEIAELRREINELRKEMNNMLKWIIGLLASMWISIVVGIIVALLKMGR